MLSALSLGQLVLTLAAPTQACVRHRGGQNTGGSSGGARPATGAEVRSNAIFQYKYIVYMPVLVWGFMCVLGFLPRILTGHHYLRILLLK